MTNAVTIPPDTVELTFIFTAQVEDVFSAWTDPAIMKQWMYSGEVNDIVQVITKPEPGGEFCILKTDREQDLVDYCGTYHEVARPNLLSFSLESPLRYEGTSSVVIRLSSDGEGCTMDFLQTGVDPALVAGIWVKMFERLGTLSFDR